jgi:serine/threonine protein phosphatase PrpC
MNISYGLVHDIGWRDSMEDEHAIYQIPEKMFFSAEIYDGHGGKKAARLAAETLTPNFLHALSRDLQKPRQERRSESENLREAYIGVDKSIVDSGTDSGTTAVTFYVIEGRFIAANVGDTRAIIGTKGEPCYSLTVDHKPSLPDEKSRIENLGGSITWLGTPRVLGILAVSRALGDIRLKPYVSCEPRIVEGYLGKENDYVVLACDGVWDVLVPGEVINMVRTAREPQAGAERIKEMALNNGSRDNISVIVLDMRNYVMDVKQAKMKITTVTDFAA